jgi:hypothetical protein
VISKKVRFLSLMGVLILEVAEFNIKTDIAAATEAFCGVAHADCGFRTRSG